jgi:hypothetical protein
MGFQTTANSNKFIFGSAKIEVGADLAHLYDLGAARGVKLKESYESVEIEIDNTANVIVGVKSPTIEIEGSLLEIDLDKLAVIRGGIDTVTPIAAAKVNDAEQEVASGDWAFNEFIEIENQNGDGSVLQIDAQGYVNVEGSVDGALTHGTDYYMVKNGQGKWGIMCLDTGSGGCSTESQVLTIAYDYTPNASRQFDTGGTVTMAAKVVRLTHTNDAGEIFQATIWSAKATEGMEISFPSDNGNEVMEIPFKMKGTPDTTRSAGAQLFQLIDERTY